MPACLPENDDGLTFIYEQLFICNANRAPPMTQNHDTHDHAGHGHDEPSHEHHSHEGHGHAGHSHAPTVSARNERAVLLGFGLTAAFMIVELVGGLMSGSLALVADAGHMLTDAVALGLAWAGFRFGRRPADPQRTFGYRRFEVLAGFVNALSLIGLVAWIAWEAAWRLLDPQPILTGPMLVVAVLGLLVNLLVLAVLRRGDTDHVNIRGAMLHVVGDLLGSVAAIAAAIGIWVTGWTPIDPILSILLSLLVLRSAWSLLGGTSQILLEGAPDGVDVAALPKALETAIPAIATVRHVHVWTITSGQTAATMEVSLGADANEQAVRWEIKRLLAARFGIAHATIEIVPANGAAECCMAPAVPDAGKHG
jgi:cobalt-zinc-cadmium efflux system protein